MNSTKDWSKDSASFFIIRNVDFQNMMKRNKSFMLADFNFLSSRNIFFFANEILFRV